MSAPGCRFSGWSGDVVHKALKFSHPSLMCTVLCCKGAVMFLSVHCWNWTQVSITSFSPKIRQRVLSSSLRGTNAHLGKHHTPNKNKKLVPEAKTNWVITAASQKNLYKQSQARSVFPKAGQEDANLALSIPTRMLAPSRRVILFLWSLGCSCPQKPGQVGIVHLLHTMRIGGRAAGGRWSKDRFRKLGKVRWQFMAKMEDFLFNEKKRWIWIESYVQRFV